MSEDSNVDWREFAYDLFEEVKDSNFSACPYDLFSMDKDGPCQREYRCESSSCWWAVFRNLKRRYIK